MFEELLINNCSNKNTFENCLNKTKRVHNHISFKQQMFANSSHWQILCQNFSRYTTDKDFGFV